MDKNIHNIIASQKCDKHLAGVGRPCWDIHQSNGQILSGVCNKRAKSAGFRGLISPAAQNKRGK